jgi:hypothetical protein
MSQDTSTSLAPTDADAHLALMGISTGQCQAAAVIILGIVSVTALLLVANGTPAGAVKEVLAVILPPLVAIAAHSARNENAAKRRGRGRRLRRIS